MTFSKLALALSVTLLSSTLAFAQTTKKAQTTTTEQTKQNPTTTTTTDSYGNTTETTTADPATADTTRTQTTTTEETEEDKEKKGGLFVEPMLTYEQGDVELTYPAPFNSSKEDLKGGGIGLRFGGHIRESLFLAVDGRYSRVDYKSSVLNGEADAAAYNAGVTLGVQTPVAGLRVWGTYIFGGELDPEKIGNIDGKYEEMKGYRVGVGLYVKVVSINLEYQDAKYGKIEINDGTTITNNAVKPEQKSTVLSVSFPIAL